MPCWPPRASQPPRSAPACALVPGRPPRSSNNQPHLLPPGRDGRLVPLGGLARRELHAPPDPVQQQVRPGQGVLRAEPPPDDLGDPRQRPALVLPSPARRGQSPAPPAARAAGLRSVCTSRRPRPWKPARPGHLRPAPAAAGSPTSATPGSAGPPPGHCPRLDQLRGQPHPRLARSAAVSPPPWPCLVHAAYRAQGQPLPLLTSNIKDR
jgi:hypothetical protein